MPVVVIPYDDEEDERLVLPHTVRRSPPPQLPSLRKSPSRRPVLVIGEWGPRSSRYTVPPPPGDGASRIAIVERSSGFQRPIIEERSSGEIAILGRSSRMFRHNHSRPVSGEYSSAVAVVERSPRSSRYHLVGPSIEERSDGIAVVERSPRSSRYIVPPPMVEELSSTIAVVERSPRRLRDSRSVPRNSRYIVPPPRLLVERLPRPTSQLFTVPPPDPFLMLPAPGPPVAIPPPQPYPVFITTAPHEDAVPPPAPEAPTSQEMRQTRSDPGRRPSALRRESTQPRDADFLHVSFSPPPSPRGREQVVKRQHSTKKKTVEENMAIRERSRGSDDSRGHGDRDCDAVAGERERGRSSSQEGWRTITETKVRRETRRSTSRGSRSPAIEGSKVKSEAVRETRLLEEAPRRQNFKCLEERIIFADAQGRRRKQYYYG